MGKSISPVGVGRLMIKLYPEVQTRTFNIRME
jgi:hypothetical protein